MLALVDEDVLHDINQGGREIGKDKLRWFLAMHARHFREEAGDAEIMSNGDGSRAAAEFTLRGAYQATLDGLPKAEGQHYSLQAAMLFEIEDGRLARVTSYFNRKELVEQLGR